MVSGIYKGVKISIEGLEKNLKLSSRGNVYFALKSNKGRTFILRYDMLEYFFHLWAI